MNALLHIAVIEPMASAAPLLSEQAAMLLPYSLSSSNVVVVVVTVQFLLQAK